MTDSATESQPNPVPPPPPGYFMDSQGKPSSMRLMSLISLFAGIWFGWMTLHSDSDSENGVFITTAFLIGAFVPKALQKFIENYYPYQRPNV